MNIRVAQESDLVELAELFRQSVLSTAPQRYTLEQTQAWASMATDIARFRQLILQPTTYVLTDDTGILGFAGIAADGYVASTYVRGDRIHQGLGSKLMQVILAHASHNRIQRLYTEASEFSLGLFKKFGFHLYDTEVVERQGVQFKRYLVERYQV
ncbi:MAG: GNAT family N-acetyltransferase [Leptolyngbyaceae cyanobacterium RM2_2_4]|nr:GNAT family N-acetyltransferase [Leptolyngbyaceae cyanobacterium SM1_4_3]NJN91305.1 GNAT family N-acetyltransferase [Leptolyngbyaceae cyanobacterium SL_5_14]NJO48496.1 GNAT family N-acetyltransferase [Leptolyngbyaceae cyanobacterium RM2_2_4]